MRKTFKKFWLKSENEEAVENSIPQEQASPVDKAISNLIKMKEAVKLLKASAPTVRKYARLGYYKEYRFGQKLVFNNKEEILNFILNQFDTTGDS
ncbi:DNA-binding protein [Dysgonomonas sp. BGC7]|uniref:DNA-binding protein n=1 Tax=Dysgonomonas sp. BGC7 TaxID=1658008 RepID=UPI000681BD38|nr:DNA-binding protein [Dysgonomonas sp. BGC7]MBD8389169.1 DNA-binding protein [Dysgonomonas sp. BGC7]